MKANLLEIIMSLFAQQTFQTGPAHQINQAHQTQPIHQATPKLYPAALDSRCSNASWRIYAAPEKEKLGEAGVNLLEELVRTNIINLLDREQVINQIFLLDTLDTQEIPLDHLRWVLFVTLAMKAKNAQELSWLDCLILKNQNQNQNNKNKLTVH